MKKLLFLLLPLMLLCSCKSKMALDFSESIVNKEKSLEADIINTEARVKNFILAGQYDSMAIVSGKMEELVDKKLNEVKNLKAPDLKFADDFKNDAVAYFAYMKNIYTSYVKLAKAETDELREKEYSLLKQMIDKKDNVITDMRNSQKKFAEANGFKLKD